MSTPTPSTLDRGVRLAAYLAGLALAVVAIAAWQVAPAASEPRTRVSFEALATGELAVAAAGAAGGALDAGARRPVSRSFEIRNQTPAPLALRPRALPSTRALDRLVLVAVDAGGRRLFHGRLGELRSGTDRALRLAPGEVATLRLRAWLRDRTGAAGGAEARIQMELPTEVRR